MADCIFCKIIAGEIPSTRLYEDENMIIIKDLNPQAPIHLLAIPREHFAEAKDMSEHQAEIVGQCIRQIGLLKEELGLSNGYRIVVNTGDDGRQSVKHLHIHILGGKQLADNMA